MTSVVSGGERKEEKEKEEKAGDARPRRDTSKVEMMGSNGVQTNTYTV